MTKYLKGAISVLAVSLLATLALIQTATAATGDNNTEQVLLRTKWWGGGIDVRRGGCGSCTFSSVAFNFTMRNGQLGVGILFKAGKEGYDAYSQGRRFPGDTKVDDTGGAFVKVNKDGSFYFDTNNFRWECRLESEAKGVCKRTSLLDQVQTPEFNIFTLPPS